MVNIKNILAVVSKDVKSEYRTRHAINSLIMFVLISVITIVFAMGQNKIELSVLSGMFWVVVFFSSMSGLSRIFVSEEERGTTLTLHLITSPTTIYFGKLLFNIALTILLTISTSIIYSIVFTEFCVKSVEIFYITLIIGSIGFASISTILAAIIAKTHNKGTLFAVIAFPLLLPLIVAVIKCTEKSLIGGNVLDIKNELIFLVSYILVIITSSNILFDYVWKE